MALRETRQQAVAVFMAPADEIAGHADVERTVATVGHHVDEGILRNENEPLPDHDQACPGHPRLVRARPERRGCPA